MAENCATGADGQVVCELPPNCGYVNGQYVCAGDSSGSAGSGATANLGTFTGGEHHWWEVGKWLSDFAGWLVDTLLYIPRKVFEAIADGLAALFEAIPVPDFITNLQGSFTGIPPGVVWWLDTFAVREGFAIVLSAYVLRFLIRRIPLIG